VCAKPGVRVRQTRLTSEEILLAHDYQDGAKDWCELFPGQDIFRLVVVSLLQQGVVERYPMWILGSPTACHSRKLDHIQIFFGP
jgi:hypothetical protein